MSLAALCGSHGCISFTSPAGPPSTSLIISELFGCAFVSSGGGLRSICVSLLELRPAVSPRLLAFTRSERGASRFGVRCQVDFDAESAFFEFAGVLGAEFCANATALAHSRITKRHLRIGLF